MYDDDYNRSGETGPLMLALVVGAAVGAVAALLFAPKSGREVRDSLFVQAGNWRTIVADTISTGRERLIDSVEKQTRS